MNMLKINSAPTFRGQLIVKSKSYNGKVYIDTDDINKIKRSQNGDTIIVAEGHQDICENIYKIDKKTAPFETILAAYKAACEDDDLDIEL